MNTRWIAWLITLLIVVMVGFTQRGNDLVIFVTGAVPGLAIMAVFASLRR